MALSLDSLPPELLALVLQATISPQQLYRLISASPACFRVFVSAPQRFLASTINNSLAPETISRMVAILRIPEMAPQLERIPQLRLVLDQYFDNISSFTLPTDKSDLVQICQLSTCLSGLIDGYFANIKCRVKNIHPIEYVPTPYSTPPPRILASTSLSSSEEIRLQRAFLRFELYCRVFPAESDDIILGSYRSLTQSRLFLSRLAPWEIEEMHCLQQYFTSTVDGFIDEMEEDILEAVLETPGVRVHGVETSTETGDSGEMRSFDFLHLTDLAMFGQLNRREYNITFMTSLGLRRLYQFFNASRPDRMRFIKENSPRRRDFLPEALSFVRQRDISQLQPEDGDDPSHANYGYFKFGPPSISRSILGLTPEYSLFLARDLGYVFWDSWRTPYPPTLDKLEEAAAIRAFAGIKQSDRARRVSVEERLKGVTLPQSEFKRIEKEFGSTYLRGEGRRRLATSGVSMDMDLGQF